MSKTNKIIQYGLYLILFLPLFFTNFTFFPWHYGKTVIFQIVVEILVIAYLWQILSFPRKRESSGQGVGFFQKLNWLDWSIIAFLAILIITAFTGVNPANSFWGNQARANGIFTWLHFGAFYFLLINFLSFDRVESFKISYRLYVAVAAIVGSIVSLTALLPGILPAGWQSLAGGGIIGNRAFLAGYLILVLGLIIYSFFLASHKWQKILWLAGFVLALTALVQTGIRGAILGVGAGILSSIVILIFVLPGKKLKISLAALLFIFAAGFFIVRRSPSFTERFPLAYALTNFSYTSGTGETRLMAWQEALQGLRDKPVLGWGWGNYEIIFNKYFNPQFLKYSFAETVWDKPHNWVLEIADSAGLVGAISYLAIFATALYYLFRKCHSERSPVKRDEVEESISGLETTQRVILSATLIAYFVQDLFLFETTNGLILWFLILALISIQSKLSLQPMVVKENQKEHKAIKKIIRYSLFFVLCFSLIRFNYVPLKYSYYMRQAERSRDFNNWAVNAGRALSAPAPLVFENAIFLAQQLTQFDKAGAINNMDEEQKSVALSLVSVLENAAKKYPDNLSFLVWAGQSYLVLGEKLDSKYFIEAERVLLLAHEVSPQKQEVLFTLVRVYFSKKDFVRALKISQEAVAVAPDIGISHWFLGLAQIVGGDRPKGLESIEKAVKLGHGLTADQKLYILDLYALERNYSKVIEEYNKLLESNPENVNWLIKLAAIYAESGDKGAALETTRRAVGLFPPLKAEAEKFIKQYKLLEK